MSTKGSMTTRARPLMQDQNMNIHKKELYTEDMSTKGSMTTRAHPLVRDQNLNIRNKGGAARVRIDGSKAQQKPGLAVRKALANITNSEKPSSHQESKKNLSKKCAAAANTGVPIAIEEERCLHNHQFCMNLPKKTSTQHLVKTILALDDEKSPLELWSPKTPSTLNQSKVDSVSTPRYLDFTQSPVSLKLRSSVRRSIPWSPFSPSMH